MTLHKNDIFAGAMSRVLYFHHYFPALLYSCMLTAVILDYLMAKVLNLFNHKATVYHVLMGIYLSGLVYSFSLFAPLTYGMDDTPAAQSNSSVHHLKWLDSWEF